MANPPAIVAGAHPTYESLRQDFRWQVPEQFNIGVACSDSHPSRLPALITISATGERTTYSFGQLAETSNRLANGLRGLGVQLGDRVGIVVPQSLETGVTHLALYKIGAIALPLASLFGPDALAYRLGDSDARAVVTTPENLPKVAEAVKGLDITVIVTGAGAPGLISFESLASAGSPTLEPVVTPAEHPAFLVYTSGTTGPPKGALHAHRSLIGHLPAFELYYEFYPKQTDIHWTPADWAWIGGLMDSLVPSWYHGRPVVTADHDFDPHWAIDLMRSEQVTCAFLPPAALKMMRAAGVSAPDHLRLRAVFTGGETLGEEMLAWGQESLGTVINEGYGQTEANLTVGNCASVWPIRPGSMGRAMPGHTVEVIDDDGHPLENETGEIAVRGPDPVFMLRYWNQPEATAAKYRDGWLLTGDLGIRDDAGYLWFVSRKDDVINSMGYRIGPGEIEESLLGNRSVASCAVVGVPDEIKGQVPVAFVVTRPGHEPSEMLAAELQEHVRTRLAAHEVPRTVYFIDEMPRTTTGKTMRRVLREMAADRQSDR
ncbi:MAG: AMP-binding protein [Acidimicrobiia bacterium]